MPLRPELYDRLESVFRNVRIANEGCEMSATYRRDALTGKPALSIRSPGEYYVVNCPFCLDTRQRLWINHRFGFLDPVTGHRNLGLCICYNENCLRLEQRRRSLYADLFCDVGDGTQDVILPGKQAALEPVKVEWPGEMVPLDQLPDDHAAWRYLEGRGFDPVMLSRQLDVCYCTQAHHWWQMAQDRIIIPIAMNGRLQGWQGRIVGKQPNKLVPKYFTMYGMRKGDLLYNLDNARKFPYVVLVEGVTDVWKVGPASVALFGKTMTATQELLVTSIWNKGTVFIMLDRDAKEDAEKIARRLRARVGKCVLIDLPDDRDPGDLSQQEIQHLIEQARSKDAVAA